MRTIEEMLRQLLRSEVTEFAIASDRLPCVKVGSDFQPVDDVAPSTDGVFSMLVAAGGSRYVDRLGPKPLSWSMHLDGVGALAVSAVLRDDVVQARFRLTKRDSRAEEPDPLPGPAPRSARSGGEPPSQARARAAASPPQESILGDDEFDLAPESVIPASPGPASPARPLSGRFEFDLELNTAPGVSAAGLKAAADSSRRASSPSMPGIKAALAPLIEESLEVIRQAAPKAPPPPAPTRVESIADLLALAREAHASDLHVVPERPLLVRIAGELVTRGPVLAADLVEAIAHGLVPERLRETLAKDGSCDFAIEDGEGRSRVSVVRQRTGSKITIRLIPRAIPTLASLGLPDVIGKATHHHQGLILVTGPTGHGKTSTLAAIVDIINSETTHHIITVEDPVEYVHPRKRAMMSQREVGTHTRAFATALKGSLREDPDVIVVGELRDTETVRMALSASETGHLVIGTMNTPSAAKTIDRLIDLFPPGDQAQVRLTLAGGLRLIVSQRLLPNSDRTGLVAACEILPGSISLWSLIRDNKTYQIPSLQQRGKGLGITRFDDSLADLVKAGKTTLEIAREFAENAEDMEMTALNKRPQVALPLGPPKQGQAGEAAKQALGGILDKAGNLFGRKGS